MQARRLGRGLEALLGGPVSFESADDGLSAVATLPGTGGGLVEVSIYEIDSNPFQPRKDLDEAELQQLAESIKEHDLLQPIVVRRVNDRYQIIAGERRLRAATKAGMEHVAAQVRDVDDRQMAELAIVENLQRKDLNALEKAASFQQYKMPIPGLWLCGAGAHPGGNVSGAAGANAAREIVKDLKNARKGVA